jgi:hypothetical protein
MKSPNFSWFSYGFSSIFLIFLWFFIHFLDFPMVFEQFARFSVFQSFSWFSYGFRMVKGHELYEFPGIHLTSGDAAAGRVILGQEAVRLGSGWPQR